MDIPQGVLFDSHKDVCPGVDSNLDYTMCRMCRAKMCRALPGQNVLQRAPGVVPECVVLCVANHDTCDTFKLRVCVLKFFKFFTVSTYRLLY